MMFGFQWSLSLFVFYRAMHIVKSAVLYAAVSCLSV